MLYNQITGSWRHSCEVRFSRFFMADIGASFPGFSALILARHETKTILHNYYGLFTITGSQIIRQRLRLWLRLWLSIWTQQERLDRLHTAADDERLGRFENELVVDKRSHGLAKEYATGRAVGLACICN